MGGAALPVLHFCILTLEGSKRPQPLWEMDPRSRMLRLLASPDSTLSFLPAGKIPVT